MSTGLIARADGALRTVLGPDRYTKWASGLQDRRILGPRAPRASRSIDKPVPPESRRAISGNQLAQFAPIDFAGRIAAISRWIKAGQTDRAIAQLKIEEQRFGLQQSEIDDPDSCLRSPGGIEDVCLTGSDRVNAINREVNKGPGASPLELTVHQKTQRGYSDTKVIFYYGPDLKPLRVRIEYPIDRDLQREFDLN